MNSCIRVPLAALFLLLAISSVIPPAGHAGSTDEGKYSVAGLDSEKEVHTFFLRFRDAVRNRDRKTVADLVSYPVKVTLANGQRVKISNAKSFLQRYDSIFDPVFTDALSKKKVAELWANSQGVATESGEIWFGGVIKGTGSSYELKILAINGITAR